jgi:hypothetical protein
MSTVQPTDKVLVQRGTTLHSTPSDMSTVQDADLLLINRGGTDYKCTFADWKASQVSVNKPSLLTPADGATDVGETPTFTSSAFSGTGVTHASSDWQVTLKADTGFASPVVQSMADTAHLLSWDGGPLQPNTDYIVRVRHNGGGKSSAWSDAVAFKTQAGFTPVMAPGQVYYIESGTNVLVPTTSPVKFINIANGTYSGGGGIAVGADGKVYTCPQNGATWTATAWTDAISVVGTTEDARVATLAGFGYLGTNGIGHYQDITVLISSTQKLSRIGGFGTYNQCVWGVGVDGKVYVTGTTGRNVLGTRWTNAWAELPLPAPLDGAKVKSIASCAGGNYDVSGLLILLENGDLYIYGVGAGATAPGLTASSTPTRILQGVKSVACAGGTYSGSQGVSALLEDGSVYWSSDSRGISWAQFFPPGSCRSAIFGGYAAYNEAYVLKSDGFIYQAPRTSSTFAKLDYTTHSVPQTKLTTLGSTALSFAFDSNKRAGIYGFLLISD